MSLINEIFHYEDTDCILVNFITHPFDNYVIGFVSCKNKISNLATFHDQYRLYVIPWLHFISRSHGL